MALKNEVFGTDSDQRVKGVQDTITVNITNVQIEVGFGLIFGLDSFAQEGIEYFRIRFKMIKTLHSLSRFILQLLINFQNSRFQKSNPIGQSRSFLF